MSVDAFLPADDIPSGIVKPSGGSGTEFQIDLSFDRPALRKIGGDPGSTEPFAARREAWLAYELAKRSDVQEVLVGKEAIQFMYGRSKRKNEQDADVIARINKSDVIIGDAKREHFGRALVQQLPYSSCVLKAKGVSVVEGAILALQPSSVVASWAMDHEHREWRQVGRQVPAIDVAAATQANPRFPCNPNYVYLLDQDFHAVHNPSGLVVKPGLRFPLLETHIHAPHLGPGNHMTPGVWSYIHPFTIPATTARVKIGFVR
ncbi:MAG TPA: hypothetical protein VGH38_02230 [Bryobacteraceae bacterium]|jgi:hypothetical protein